MRHALHESVPALLLAALLCLAATGCGASSDAPPVKGKACKSQDCFATHFSNCEAAHYQTDRRAGATARYQILGTREAQCRVQMLFVENPNASPNRIARTRSRRDWAWSTTTA